MISTGRHDSLDSGFCLSSSSNDNTAQLPEFESLLEDVIMEGVVPSLFLEGLGWDITLIPLWPLLSGQGIQNASILCLSSEAHL